MKYIFLLVFLFSSFWIFGQDDIPETEEELNIVITNLVDENRYEEAVSIVEKFLELHQDSVVAMYYLGRIFARQAEYGQAVQLMNHALEQTAPIEDALTYSIKNDLGWTYFLSGNTIAAEGVFTEIIDQAESVPDPLMETVLNNLGVLKITTENYDEAANYFNKAVQDYESITAQQRLDILSESGLQVAR